MKEQDQDLVALDSERVLLGSLILDGERVPDVRDEQVSLDPEDFVDRGHGEVFRSLLDLSARGAAIDFVSVSTWLDKDPEAQRLQPTEGWQPFLVAIASNVTSTAHLLHHAKVVRDCALARGVCRILQAGEADIRSAQPGLDDGVPFVIEAVEGRLHEFTSARNRGARPVSFAEAMQEFLRMRTTAPTAHAIPTGLCGLDQMIVGLKKKQLGVIGARPAVGKSAVLLGVAINAARNGSRVLFVSLEMSIDEVMMRAASNLANVDLQRIAAGQITGEAERSLRKAAAQVFSFPLHLYDSARSTVDSIRARARHLKRRQGLDVLVVDYLQRVQCQGKKDRWEEVSKISWDLKALAMELDIPVVAACQLSRQAVGERPQLHHLKESGAIEQDADWVVLLWEEQEDRSKSLLHACVAKQRNGPIGDFTLRFERHVMRVSSPDVASVSAQF